MANDAAWGREAARILVGRRVKAVSYMTQKEAARCGYTFRPLVIIFDDGSAIWAQSDDEGNDAGALATTDKMTPTLPVMR